MRVGEGEGNKVKKVSPGTHPYRVRYYLAAAYERVGETGRALEVCRRALDLQPGHPYLIEMVERLSDRAAS